MAIKAHHVHHTINNLVVVDSCQPGGDSAIDNCITFSSAQPFSLSITNGAKIWDGSLYYSLNGSTWSEWNGDTSISSAKNDGEQRIYMRGKGNSILTEGGTTVDIHGFAITGDSVRCDGNIETLLDYETVANGEHPTMAYACFGQLFQDCTALTTAPDLPSPTLSEYCYNYMFYGCTGLEKAPDLPAIALVAGCYRLMFGGCTSLKLPPKILATSISGSLSCHCMFQNCTALESAPELLATTMSRMCYMMMFRGCTSLKKAPGLPATKLAYSCYSSMFDSCTALESAIELPATVLEDSCYSSMFWECTSLKTLPKLPATNLTEFCYQNMFYGCTGIKMSTTKTGEYQTEYRIPTSGAGATDIRSLDDMFGNTGGTFTGTPSVNTIYYTSNTVI